MSRIFISHSSRNNREGLALKWWLESQGWKDEAFLDLDPVVGIKTGTRWKEALAQANSRCEAIICLTSPEWVNSPECVAEYRTAENINATLGQTRKPILIFVAQIAELGSTDKTREWQGCKLFGDGQMTEISLGPGYQAIRFLTEGLARLKHGLLEAGISRVLPKHFPWPPKDYLSRAPYRGLESFEGMDAGIFFGRDVEILRGLAELERMRLAGDLPLFVILGASGTGKSSFLRAGLAPRLSNDDRHFFPLDIIRPERSPLFGQRGLAHAIAMANDRLHLRPVNPGDVKTVLNDGPNRFAELLHNIQEGARIRLVGLSETETPPTLVLMVDQAEELFNADATDEAKLFLRLIGTVLRDGSGTTELSLISMIVAFTIRSDRYEPLQTASELAGLKTVVFDDLRPMPAAQFKDVIMGPASRTLVNGRPLEVKLDLVSRLLDDCARGADTLPLLALTLARLYRDYGNDGDLRLDEYLSMGGMAEVIKTEAESVLNPDPNQRKSQLEWLHAAFVPWLATINRENDQPMRRLARMSDLNTESRPLVEALIEKRLLLSDLRDGERVVEVAHESLLRKWDILAEWLNVEREDLKEADRLVQDAMAWTENGKKEAWLREGERLSIGEALAAKPAYQKRLKPVSEFLLTSRQREEQRRQAEFIAAKEKLSAEIARDFARIEEKLAQAQAFHVQRERQQTIKAVTDAVEIAQRASLPDRLERVADVLREILSSGGLPPIAEFEHSPALCKLENILVFRVGNQIVAYDLERAVEMYRTPIGSYHVTTESLSGNQKYLASADVDGALYVTDLSNGKSRWLGGIHEPVVRSVSLNWDGTICCAVNGDKTTYWNVQEETEIDPATLRMLESHRGEIAPGVAVQPPYFSLRNAATLDFPDIRTLNHDRYLQILREDFEASFNEHSFLRVFTSAKCNITIAVSPYVTGRDHRLYDVRSVVYTYPRDGYHWLFVFNDRKQEKICNVGAPPLVDCAVASPDGKYLVTCSNSSVVMVWGLHKIGFVCQISEEDKDFHWDKVFFVNQYLLLYSPDSIFIFDIETKQMMKSLKVNKTKIDDVRWDLAGSTIYVLCENDTIYWLDLPSNNCCQLYGWKSAFIPLPELKRLVLGDGLYEFPPLGGQARQLLEFVLTTCGGKRAST